MNSSLRKHIPDLRLKGSIVRIAPNTLSINTAGALEEIYASRKANVQKADWYRTIDAGSGAFSTHSEIDRKKHAFRRRVLAHAFSDTALRSAETLILENVSIWCEYLGSSKDGEQAKEWTLAKNMCDWANYLSYDIMGNLTFGTRFECIEKEKHRYVPGLMMRATKYVYVVSLQFYHVHLDMCLTPSCSSVFFHSSTSSDPSLVLGP